MKTNECKNCKQGYTKDGNAAYPDYIELCELHAAAPQLVEALLVARDTCIAESGFEFALNQIETALKAAGVEV